MGCIDAPVVSALYIVVHRLNKPLGARRRCNNGGPEGSALEGPSTLTSTSVHPRDG
jgi:hypothetical protein